MKIALAFLAGVALTIGGTATAQTVDPIADLTARILGLEQSDAEQDARLDALEAQVAKAQRDASYAIGSARFAQTEGESNAYRLRRCGTVRDAARQSRCFYRLF